MAKGYRYPVDQLKSGDRLEQIFLISQPQLRTTTKGDYYIAAFLQDSTGKVNSRMWNATEAIYKTLPNEGFVNVLGRVEMYQNSLQVVVEAIRPVTMEEVDLSLFLPQTEKNPEQMFGQLVHILRQIQNPHMQKLVEAFLADAPLMERFKKAPAAIALHHAYLGGLLEHTLSVLELGCLILPKYPALDADLVLAGLFLHDIGKTTEIGFDISFKYTDEGRLVGHLVKGALLIQEKVQQLNLKHPSAPFPEVLADTLEHIIVSHHGTREFGCPVLPATPEAFVVHYLDNLDSKIALTFTEIEKDVNSTSWTNFVKAVDGPLFKVRTFTNP